MLKRMALLAAATTLLTGLLVVPAQARDYHPSDRDNRIVQGVGMSIRQGFTPPGNASTLGVRPGAPDVNAPPFQTLPWDGGPPPMQTGPYTGGPPPFREMDGTGAKDLPRDLRDPNNAPDRSGIEQPLPAASRR